MPYEISWLVENRVLYTRIYGVFEPEDMSVLEETVSMSEQAIAINGENGPLVHTITDAVAMTGQKIGIAEAEQSIKSLRKQKVGWSLYVNKDRMQRFLATLGHQFAGVRYRAFDNLPDALAFLQEADPTLPSLAAP